MVCRDFNKIEGCMKNSPYEANVRGRRRQVKHFYVKCWTQNQEILEHSEVSDLCPNQE